jgi:CubicO group peptidase (beta-lactamase class C family)
LTNVTLAGVETLFRQQQARGAFPGGQLVVQHGDQRLLDVAVGTASGWRRAGAARTKVTETTQFQVMSASKAVLAVAVARLEERRLIAQSPLIRPG